MVDIQYIRENVDQMKKNILLRGMDPSVVSVDKLVRLDEERRNLIALVDDLRAQRNEISAAISGPQDKEKIEAATEIKSQLQEKEKELESIQEAYQALLWLMPNQIHPDVPEGKDENENVPGRTWGEIPSFDFEVKDHVELGEALDLIDIKSAAKVSGARFGYIKNELALMQFGIVQMVFKTVTNREIISELAHKVGNKYDTPFVPVVPPVLMRPNVMDRMGRLQPIEDRFVLEKDDFVLVGSAEHTLGPIHMDEIIAQETLPIRYIGYSTAFRQEAGSYGKDTRGILRVHQFDKLEFETFSLPDDGEAEQDLLVALQEYFLQQLEIPYQMVQICTGDMGKPDYRQIDLESWIPAQNSYRETHTSDYMTDFQARRLDIRYQSPDGEKGFVHMNDATAVAVGRVLIAIMENYQQADGSIKVPTVLIPYVGKDTISPKD
ncbi:serine--tRNA ligase [candidate division WWE3 bacterium]|uniref:Serine--tRNA ligase n=1 Tax=candidate division WWE3 bacterium TaxID=2053526 RepID=A0A955RQC8_UNCKA|nr:serine--tRNA ligase [candidate division WWE3 bacterium]